MDERPQQSSDDSEQEWIARTLLKIAGVPPSVKMIVSKDNNLVPVLRKIAGVTCQSNSWQQMPSVKIGREDDLIKKKRYGVSLESRRCDDAK
jgi:hypothetical protein